MWNGFVGNLIRRTNQRVLILALVLLAGLAAFFGYKHSYFYGIFAGAHPVSSADLTRAASSAAFANPFVTVKDDGGETTNLQEMHQDNGQNVLNATFASVVVGGHHMLVRLGPDAILSSNTPTPIPAATLTGQLKPTSELHDALYGNYTTPEGDLLPVYLDVYDYKTPGYIGLAIGIPILLLALWMFGRWWQVSSDFSRHPICRQLAGQGQLELLVQQLDSEMAAPHQNFQGRGRAADLSQHWLVINNFASARVMQLSNVVWAHRSVVQRRIYFVITVSRRHLVNVFDTSGQKMSIQLSETKVQDLFEHLRILTPRAIHGFDKRLPGLWRATPNKQGFPEAAAALLSGDSLQEQRVTSIHGG